MLISRTVRILGLCCLLGVSPLLAEEALVSMPAGFLRVELSGGESKAVSLPWFAWDDSVQAILAHGMKGATNGGAGDRALKFDPALPGYVRAVRVDSPDGTGVWVDDASAAVSAMTLNPGEGIVLENRAAAGSASRVVFLAGEVVMEAEYPLELEPGLNLISPPFAAAGTNELTGLNLGQAGWVYSEKQKTLKFSRPYANLFPIDPAALPRIASLTPAEDAQSITLGIRCTGVKGELLDVYAQDLETNGTFQAEGPWKVLVIDIPSLSRTELTWTDVLENPAPFARVYLVARVDVGVSDATGISAARRQFLDANELARIEAAYATSNTNGISGDASASLLPDGLSGTNGVALPVLNRRSIKVVYVNQKTGKDSFSGRLAAVTTDDGPKKTIRNARQTIQEGDRLVIHGGRYGEDLDLRGLRNVKMSLVGHVDLRGHKPARDSMVIPPIGGIESNAVNTATNTMDAIDPRP